MKLLYKQDSPLFACEMTHELIEINIVYSLFRRLSSNQIKTKYETIK
jgi:hypothetical protein